MSTQELHIPDPEVINNWNDIQDLPIVETAPRTAPLINIVQPPIDDDFASLPGIVTGVTGSSILGAMNDLSKFINLMDDHTAYFYPLRSTTQDLENTVKNLKLSKEKTSPVAINILRNLVRPIQKFKEDCDTTIDYLTHLLRTEESWNKGNYCEEILNQILKVLYRMECLSQMNPTRKSISNDISEIFKLAGGKNDDIFPVQLRIWANTHTSVRRDAIEKMSKMSFEHALKIFNIFFNHIRRSLNEKRYIFAEMETVYIVGLTFFIDFFTYVQGKEAVAKPNKRQIVLKEIPNEVFTLLLEMRSKHPSVSLIYEFSLDFDELLCFSSYLRDIKNAQIQKGINVRNRVSINLENIMNSLKSNFYELSTQYAKLKSGGTYSTDLATYFITNLPIVLSTVSDAIQSLSEVISDKIHYASVPGVQTDPAPPENNQDLPISSYEKAMRTGLSGDEREYFMQIIALCRSTRELIEAHLPKTYTIVSASIQSKVQDFVKNKLEIVLLGLANNKSFNPDEITRIRTMIGYFKDISECGVRSDKIKDLTSKPHPIDELKASPHKSLVELLRIQIQMIINPDSSYRQRQGLFSGKLLADEDVKTFQAYINDSLNYSTLLSLNESLNKACDQSPLFFKEYHLDVYRTSVAKVAKGAVYFPVTTSLPYILVDYAISHSSMQELVGAIFYPLSIYDDAAATALKVMKSAYLYNEIKVECEICLMTISKMIVEFAFESIRNNATRRFLDQFKPNLLISQTHNLLNDVEDASSLRFPVILQQSQLFLLGNHIDVKSLFTARLNELFIQGLKDNFAPVNSNGLLGILLLTNGSKILRDAHSTFVSFGLPLIPFEQLESQSLQTDTPNSFKSLVLDRCIQQLVSVVIPKFFIYTNPYRIVPPPDLESLDILKKNKKLPHVLRQTTAFITVEHFRALLDLLDDGSVYLMGSEICSLVSEAFQGFLACYKSTFQYVKRISDVSTGSGCNKAYENYEAAYRSFSNDPNIDSLYDSMRIIGNIVAVAEMLDIAYLLKRTSSQQVFAYLFGSKHDNLDYRSEDFFSLFGGKFSALRNYFSNAMTAPSEKEIAPPFMFRAIAAITELCNRESEIFKERSFNLFDFPSLTGFASIWSVLEFVFCLKEVHRKDETEPNKKYSTNGSFSLFGEGVVLCASCLLCVLKQQPLYKVLCIGERISQQKRIEEAGIDDENLTRFLTVFQFVQKSQEFAHSSLSPTVEGVLNKK